MAIVSRVVSDKLGLHFPENRYQDLLTGIRLAARELGFMEDGTDFISLLADQKLTGKQLDTLAEKLTIGETYFFREPQSLAAFREMIIPGLVREREHTTRSIRIWSAGCCSGEEPYTLAMILSEVISDLDSWDITILATDINRRFLQKAATGRYTPWSFRETAAEMKARYFVPDGKEFGVIEKIRNMVRFQHLNLVTDPFPSAQTNTGSMDVIFCRNVLMYFTPDQALTAGEKFSHSLTDRGWFITSQVELSDELFHLFGKVQYRNSFLYRKGESPHPESGGSHEPERKVGDVRISSSGKNRSFRPPTEQRPPQHTAIPLLNPDPEFYYIQGMILLEQGDTGKAADYLKKVLYLDPDHLLAHFQMATLCRKAGKEQQARKHTENVRELIQRFRDEDLIPGSDGMTAGHLKRMLQPLMKQPS